MFRFLIVLVFVGYFQQSKENNLTNTELDKFWKEEENNNEYTNVEQIYEPASDVTDQESSEDDQFQIPAANISAQSDLKEAENLSPGRKNKTCNNKIIDPEEDLETKYNKFVNCSRCMLREETKVFRIEAIKTQILSKLNMKRAPNVTRPLPNASVIQQLIEQQTMMNDSPFIEEDQHYHASTEKVIMFNTDAPKSTYISDDVRSHIIYFSLSDKLSKNRVAKANLWIFIRQFKQQTTVMLNISKISCHPKSHHKINITTLDIIKMDLKRNGQWYSYDIKKIASHWARHPKENFGILVQALTHDGKNLVVIKSHDVDELRKPFLELHLKEAHERRNKRMVSLDCHEKSSEQLCCRYPLIVDFEDFKWDWIIAPKRYEANYCSGECPFVFLQKYLHTHLVQQVNPQGSAGPCCAPTKMSAISMLHFDDSQNIIYSTLPGMVVDKCGCF